MKQLDEFFSWMDGVNRRFLQPDRLITTTVYDSFNERLSEICSLMQERKISNSTGVKLSNRLQSERLFRIEVKMTLIYPTEYFYN